jgi:predicted ArsR family transcriptional regulator
MAVSPRLVISPRQEQLLILLKERGRMAPSDIWDALGVSRQGALKLMNPLLDAGLIVREGTRKSGYYRIKP